MAIEEEKVSELERAVEQLKLEGYTSEDIREALSKMREDALKEPRIWGSLDEYFDSLYREETAIMEQCIYCQTEYESSSSDSTIPTSLCSKECERKFNEGFEGDLEILVD